MNFKLIEVVARVLEIDSSKVSLETTRQDCDNWDSLAHLMLISEVEDEFMIKIPFKKINEINSVADFHTILETSS